MAVSKVVKFYKIKIEDILVIQDDLDLKVGTYKVKKNSSSGGHNGIKSIISELSSEEFLRIKVGIGKNSLMPTDKYVLAKIPDEELKLIESNFPKFNELIENFIDGNIEK